MSEPDASPDVSNKQLQSLVEGEGFYEKSKFNRMGLFFTLFDGTFCLKSKELPAGEDGWEIDPIKTTNPKTKTDVFTFVKRFDKLVCRVVDVNKRRAEFNDGGKVTNWNFTVMAGGKKATIQTVWADQLLRKFLKVAPNIDFERPIIFSAFRKTEQGKTRQLISIRQGDSDDLKDWTAVPYYWTKPRDENDKVDLSQPAVGRDGSILPEAVHDEDEDTWDFKAQNKFLADHFVKNDLPRIKEIAERLGLNKDMTVDTEGGAPEFSGPPQEKTVDTSLHIVKERPDRASMTSPRDAMTPTQSTEIRRLAKLMEKDEDALSNKIVGEDFDDLNVDGAGYVIYKLTKKLKKLHEQDPEKFLDPDNTKSKMRQAIDDNKPKKAQSDDDDDDDWGTAPAPKQSASVASSDDDDEDADWG